MLLGLWGREYHDYCYDVIDHGEEQSNPLLYHEFRLGGGAKLAKMFADATFIKRGSSDALIIEDKKSGSKKSYTKNQGDGKLGCILPEMDWLHVMYADDVTEYGEVIDSGIPYSIDFCTDSPRSQYEDLIEGATLIFDSRDRKHLYEEDKKLVLHDEYGCEFEGLEHSIVPEKGINKNGAGDIFAYQFIYRFLNHGVISAVRESCSATTSILMESTDER